MPIPLANFLTWTTYGTWLHGDERGSVDDQHNGFGQPRLASDHPRSDWSRGALVTAPVVLTDSARAAVRDSVLEHAKATDSVVHALSVRTNHVHLVVRANHAEPGRLAGGFKAWATRALRERNLAAPDAYLWTKRGSNRYLWDTQSLAAAIDYVARLQGPPDPFTLRSPLQSPLR